MMSHVPKLRFKEFSGEWEEKPIGKILTVGSGKDYKHLSDGNIPVYGTGGYMLSVNDYLYEGESVCIGRKGTIDKPILLTGKFWTVDTLFYTHSFNGSIPRFVFPIFQKINWKLYNEASGVPSLSKSTIEKIKISIPSKQEQEKIASFLTSVDTKVELLVRKEELLQQYKKGVMQKIFSQEIRFKADDGSDYPAWKKEKLSKYLVEYKQKSTVENEYPVLTSSNKGLMLQSDYFGENRLTERDNTGFNVVPNNFITYRSRSDNRTFTFNMNLLGHIGIISTYYPVFESKEGDNRFIVTLLNENKNLIGKYSVGTSQTVLSFNELKNIRMLIPSAKEQTKIANFLSSIDSKIEHIQKQLDATKAFKKALLQQMFV